MLVLTMGTMLMIPPQVIGGIFGMNVKVPFQSGEDGKNVVPYIVVICTMVFFIIIIAFIMRCLSESMRMERRKRKS